jgi:hypothetical protein
LLGPLYPLSGLHTFLPLTVTLFPLALVPALISYWAVIKWFLSKQNQLGIGPWLLFFYLNNQNSVKGLELNWRDTLRLFIAGKMGSPGTQTITKNLNSRWLNYSCGLTRLLCLTCTAVLVASSFLLQDRFQGFLWRSLANLSHLVQIQLMFNLPAHFLTYMYRKAFALKLVADTANF